MVPIEDGPHKIEWSNNDTNFSINCIFEYPQNNALTINTNKLTGKVEILKAGEAASPTTIGGMTFGDMKSKFTEVAASAVTNLSEKVTTAVNPVELDIPEGGVVEPDGYLQMGSHLEIVSMTSANALDAKHPYTQIHIDDELVYIVKDGQKLNIAMHDGEHKVHIKTRGTDEEMTISLQDVAYIKIVVDVSNKLLVSRHMEKCDSKDDFNGLYAESVIDNGWDGGYAYAIENNGTGKGIFAYVYPDRVVVLYGDGRKETIDFKGQYFIFGSSGRFRFTDGEYKETIIESMLTYDAYSYINDRLKEINADDQDFVKARSFSVSFGCDDQIQISPKFGELRVVDKNKKVKGVVKLSDVVSYEAYEDTPAHRDVVSSALAGSILAGKENGKYGAYLAASHAKDVNNSIKTYEVWITVKTSGSTDILKAAIGDPITSFQRGSDTHQKYIEEYKKFAAYMKTNTNQVDTVVTVQSAESVENKALVNASDPTEEIRKYKSLLDEGIITQEEFDFKKKQLLRL